MNRTHSSIWGSIVPGVGGGANPKWMNFGTYIHFEAMAALEPRKEYQHLGYEATATVKSGATVDENRTDGSTVVLGMRLIDQH